MDKTLYALTAASTFVFTLGLAFFVLAKSAGSLVNRYYAIWALCVSFWSLFLCLSVYEVAPHNALLYVRALHIFAIILPAVYVHFVLSFINDGPVPFRSVGVWYGLSFLSLFLLLSPKFLHVTYRASFGFYITDPGIFYPIHMASFIGAVAYVYALLFFYMRKSTGQKKEQLRYFFLATMVGYSGGLTNYLINYDFKLPILYPLGNITILIYVVIIGFAIVKYQLLDIQVIVRRTAVFAGLFAFVYGVFAGITLLGQHYFKDYYGWNQWVATIPTVFIITFVLRPLDNALTNITEKYLFQKKFNYKDLLRTFTNEVLTVLDLQQLPQQTVAGLIRILKLESAAILLHHKESKKYTITSSIGVRDAFAFFEENDQLPRMLQQSQRFILRDKTVDTMDEGDLKAGFKALGAQLCLPISLHEELIGILSLGMKKSGEDFTPEDIDILSTLARTLAIAIANAQLFDELSKTQAEAAQREKMAVIGTLAAGINHEICNPLGIVRGQCEMFLLNYRDGFYKEKSQEEVLKMSAEIMSKVIKETDRATAITKKLSSFAKPSKKSDFEQVIVEKEVEEVLGLVGHDLKLSNIDVQQDFPVDFPVILADRKQIQEVLFNIIRNAAQAIDKKQGRIVISGFHQTGQAVIRIADNGSGIPKEKIEQIFHPFYTTKAPGKGTGLGLFIVKQIVERNKGTIEVESELGVGTTFTLRFPSAASLVAAA